MNAPSSSGASGHAHRSHRWRISRAMSSLFASWSSQPLLRLVEQLAADQHPPDLGRAGADLVQLGIAPQAPGRVFVDVAVAAERLNRLTRHPRGLLGCVEYRTRGVLARHLAAVAGLRHRVNVRLAGIHRGILVGEFALHALQLTDRLTELRARLHTSPH